MKYLIDSNIIIYYFNGDEEIFPFIEEHKALSSISIITYYEVLNYDFDEEEEKVVKEFLDGFEIINISKNIMHQALQNRKNKKIKMADNFILSTAQLLSLDLVTQNIKDFQAFDIQLKTLK